MITNLIGATLINDITMTEANKIADETYEKLLNDYNSSAKEVEEMIKQMPDKAAKLLLIKLIRSID